MALRHENGVNEIVGYDENGMKLACVQFPAMNSDAADMGHTEMDLPLQGQGVGDELMGQLTRRLRDEKKKAALTCLYAQHWFDSHPENKNLVAE